MNLPANALFEIECGLNDLRRAARDAELQLGRAIGGLLFRDGKYAEAPDPEEADLAIFAVSAVAERAEQIEQLFNGSRKSTQP